MRQFPEGRAVLCVIQQVKHCIFEVGFLTKPLAKKFNKTMDSLVLQVMNAN